MEKEIFRTAQTKGTCDGTFHWVNDMIYGDRWKDGRCNCQELELGKKIGDAIVGIVQGNKTGKVQS